jgi:hypothetical protein
MFDKEGAATFHAGKCCRTMTAAPIIRASHRATADAFYRLLPESRPQVRNALSMSKNAAHAELSTELAL